MCTLSFVPTASGFVFTSNRDEQVLRPSIAPKIYQRNHQKILFPKDPKSGGSWFAAHQNGSVVVLLNGATEKHVPKPFYKKSRGLVVLELISKTFPEVFWDKIRLKNTEAFTIILFRNQQLFQLRWDGFLKQKKQLSVTEAHFWSSSTLYEAAIRTQRKAWFLVFMNQNKQAKAKDLIDFHQNTESTNAINGLIIDRNSLKTLSITQVELTEDSLVMSHRDLITGQLFENRFL